jgi:hypothetical protein
MKTIYFVTEGQTDQVVLEGLVAHWLEGEDFDPRHIQPPTSAYSGGLSSNLSQGWKGVLAWCAGQRPSGAAGRNEALRLADCLFIHTDADVASDPAFKTPPYPNGLQNPRGACNWVRQHLTGALGGGLPPNVVLCVPAQDLEAGVLCALHPDVADKYMPIESRKTPGTLLNQRKPYKLKKTARSYEENRDSIIADWGDCTSRCPEAMRFEIEARKKL